MAPVESYISENHFDLLLESCCDGNITVSKYKSKRTGITVVIADVKGPLVNGYLGLATEAHDDDGLPHTLEHMVFMGSEDYPYKGVLDLIANRCLASGTNAWTEVSHTVYTMNMAGSEGFLNLLPVYLDHVLYPTLKDSACLTEVHHVNGEGEDAGIVYCEIQGRENSGESRCTLEYLRAMYPGRCGYKSETGGIMKNLRESTTNEKIRNYHRTFYRPENLLIIITGKVNPAEVFAAIRPFEDKILTKGKRSAFERPWQSVVPPLEGPVNKVVPFPCDDDEHGLVYVSWRGPAITSYSEVIAVELILEYLTKTSVAPLRKEFVETADPFCGKILAAINEASVTSILLKFTSVPKEKLPQIKQKLQDTLQKIVQKPESLDMKRFATVIRRMKLDILGDMEDNAHDSIAERMIADFLYGNSYEDLHSTLQKLPLLNQFLVQKAEFWIGLIRKYFVDGLTVVIIGEASPSLMKTMTETENERIAATRKILGEDGLKRKAVELQNSIEENEKEAPDSIVTSVPIPGVKSIHFHSIKRSCSYMDNKDDVDGFPLSNLPYRFQLDDVNSVFLQIAALVDTSHLSQHLRLYLPLWIELVFESSLVRDGNIIPYEDVVAELAEDTVVSYAVLGVSNARRFSCGSFAQIVKFCLKTEPEKYLKATSWLKEVLLSSQFVNERIAVVAKKMIKDVSEIKRDGATVASILLRNINFGPNSNHWAASALRQQAFLSQILDKLVTQPQEVIGKLEEIRNYMKDHVTIHMSSNVKTLAQKVDLRSPWSKNAFVDGDILYSKSQVQPCSELVLPLDSSLPMGLIAGIGAVESSYLIQTVPIAISYIHPDLPAVLVLIQYLVQLEGPLWRQLRGKGLTYSYSISLDLDERLLSFELFKSTHLIHAYKEAQAIVEQHITGMTEWDNSLLEASRSSVIFSVIAREQNVASVSLQSCLAYYRNLDMDYNRRLLELVSQVEIKDLQRVGPLYFKSLFDPSKSRCAVCCHPNKVQEIVNGFQKMSKKLTVVESLEDDLITKFDMAN